MKAARAKAAEPVAPSPGHSAQLSPATPAVAAPDVAAPEVVAPDVIAVACAAFLVALAALVGWWLTAHGTDVWAPAAPLYAGAIPHAGPGTGPAVLIAVLVVWYGPTLAARLPWRRLLGAGYLAAVGWTLALALVDGWQPGVAGRLTTPTEYLREVPGVTDIGGLLREFAGRILPDQVDSWSTHTGAHPPGALLTFVWLDRLGLGGGAASGLVCILVGASAGLAVAVALRALGAEAAARAALPFAVLFPGAIWVGVSADGLFAGVLAWAVALLALGTARRDRAGDALAVAGGVLLGFALHLSYGLALAGLFPLAVLALTRRMRPVLLAGLGAAAVVAVFVALGFRWWEGYDLVKILYYAPRQLGTERPYGYWVWAAPAALAVALGPATVAGLRRMIAAPRAAPAALATLAGAALLAVTVADLTGLSKGEVERIWLPFAVWLVATAALLPARWGRHWLAAQAVTALLVNHLLSTPW